MTKRKPDNMEIRHEDKITESLRKVCDNNYNITEYAINGKRESAICITERDGKWMVFQQERGVEHDIVECETLLEACICFLIKLGKRSKRTILINEFSDELVK